MSFGNEVVGGGGELVRDQIRSRDYVPGVSGWRIARNGDAEFNNVTVRGTLEARNGNAFIKLDPSQPDLEFNPDDTVFDNGFLQFVDVGGTAAETLLQGAAKPGQGVPIIQLTSNADVRGLLTLDCTNLNVNADLTDFVNGTIRVFEGPVTITNGLADQVTWGKRYKEKATDKNYNNNATLTDDAHLFFECEPFATYVFEFYLICTSPTNTPDLKMDFTIPAGSDLHWTPNALDPSVAAGTVQGIVRLPDNVAGNNRAIAAVGTGTSAVVAVGKGRLKTDSTVDNLQLRMCQNTLTAEDTKVLAGSWMTMERVV